MTTNKNARPEKRIFTVAYRNGIAILTDSKRNAQGSGTSYKFEDDSTIIAGLKAVNFVLSKIPTNVNFDNKISILLPESISYLGYEDTREYWLTNRTTKQGKTLTPELLEQVTTMHELLKTRKHKVQIFNQKKLTSRELIAYRVETWNVLNKVVPNVSATSFEI